MRLSGLRTFITPVMLHFGTVLLIAALLSIPGQTRISVASCTIAVGMLGTIYSGNIAYRVLHLHRTRTDYVPVLADWLWNVALPLSSYVALVLIGVWLLRDPLTAIYGIGAATLTLLFIGIHNAWDIAVWISAERPGAQQQVDSQQV